MYGWRERQRFEKFWPPSHESISERTLDPSVPKCHCNDHLLWLVGLFSTSAVRSGEWSGLDFTAKPRAQPIIQANEK